jgi:hypothetical protein
MRLPLTRSESIELTTIIIHLTPSHLCLLLLVSLGGYIVNSWDFYSFRIIGKLTDFLQLQEFSLCTQTVDFSTSTARRCPHSLKQKSVAPSPRMNLYVLIFKNTYSPITLANFSSVNLVFIFGCSRSPSNPVYVRRVDSSSLVFSLSSHRHSNIGLVYNSHFIDSL